MTDTTETDDPITEAEAGDPASSNWYSEATATFGDRMTGAREAMGLSEAALAERLGVKVKTIRAWEDDRAEPRANRLQMLAGILGVSIMWLLNGEGEGLDAPGQAHDIPDGMDEILQDLRRLKVEQARLAESTARLEKRLRLALASGGTA